MNQHLEMNKLRGKHQGLKFTFFGFNDFKNSCLITVFFFT